MSTHVYTTNRKSNILIISECEPGCELTPVYYSVYQSDVNFHPKKNIFSKSFLKKMKGVEVGIGRGRVEMSCCVGHLLKLANYHILNDLDKNTN